MKKSVFIILSLVVIGIFILTRVMSRLSSVREPVNRDFAEPLEGAVSESNINIKTIPLTEKYPLHKDVIATIFWVGEEPGPDNNYAGNVESAWNANWVESFGGVDTPDQRNGSFPQGFTPKENPFYVALPYSDFDEVGRKENLTIIPWYEGFVPENVSLVKNRWVKIYHKDKLCFAQWENSGPGESDDVDYIFGTAAPKNTFGQRAGIDLSPALRDCLGIGSVSKVDWQFVDEEDVPSGPWKLIITRSEPDWGEK